MPPRARIAIGAGALLIFIGFYFAAVERHRRDEGRRFFAAEGRRLADLWAARLADRWDDPSARDTLVRRLRAETDSRAAGLGDAEGVLVPGFCFRRTGRHSVLGAGHRRPSAGRPVRATGRHRRLPLGRGGHPLVPLSPFPNLPLPPLIPLDISRFRG